VHGDAAGANGAVWAAIYDLARAIPGGRVMSYGQIAACLGYAVSPRAVGWAMYHCPEDVPWHRVVNASGGCSTERRGDFPPGLQRALLEREGVVFGPNGHLDMATYRWQPPLQKEVSVHGRVEGEEVRQSLQELYAPGNRCFGCGPANEKGLRIKSFVDGDEVVCRWTPEPHHEAFSGVLNGGIIGVLFDCHCNWTAAYHLMQRRGMDRPPCTVTAEYAVTLRRPTPSAGALLVRARVVESGEDRATVEAALEAAGKITATARGVFVAVGEGHPAYHRW
jgi:alkylated DNA nucleotide flippase Atl1/acyl-coenzyme A thioesterase PaaI-like protein